MFGTKDPPTIFRTAFESDSKEILNQIKEFLALAVQLHDYDRVSLYIRRLNSYLDSQYPLTASDCLQLITILFPFVVSEDVQRMRISMLVHTQCILTLVSLLKKKRLLQTLADFSLPWRPLFDTLAACHLNTSKRLVCANVPARSANATALVKLIKRSKHWFAAGAAKEIRLAVDSQLSPFDNRYFQAQAVLNIFLPVNSGNLEDGTVWVPRYVNMLNWADHCPHSFLCWVSLISKYAKHSWLASIPPAQDSASKKIRLSPPPKDTVDWNSHLPVILNTFLQSIGLNVAGEAPKEHNRAWPSYWFLVSHMGHSANEGIANAVAKLIVYTIRPGVKSEELLKQLMSTVATFYQPSNGGQWTPTLSAFLRALSVFIFKRRKKEREIRKLPVTYSQNDLFPYDNKLADILIPVALTAIYAKNEGMVQAGERCLRYLSYLYPHLIFPTLLKQFEEGLQTVTESNRMMTALKSLAVVTTPLLNRSIYKSGGAHLQQLLTLALPGLEGTDPVKTTFTLAFLSIVFYTVPFIDARESHPNYSGTSRDSDSMEYGNDDNENEDANWKTTFIFKDWAMEFLDRIIRVINLQDKFGKKSMGDQAMLGLTKRAMRGFFECVSKSIYTACIDKLARVIAESESVNARKYVGALISSAAPVYPKLSLPRLFTPLFNRLFTESKSSSSSSSSSSESKNNNRYEVASSAHTSDLQWGLYMLACTVSHSGGAGEDNNSLLPYIDQIRSAYELTCGNSDKMVRKMANKLLRSGLVGLTQVYPAESRAFDPQTWAQFEAKGKEPAKLKHWEHWGSFGYDQLESDRKTESALDEDVQHELELKIQWHQPTKEELTAAMALAESCSTAPLSFIESVISKSTGAPPTELVDKDGVDRLVVAITQLVNISRGASSILGPLDGILVPEKEESETRCPARSVISTRVFPHLTRDGGNNRKVSFRTFLAGITHRLATHLNSSTIVPNIPALSRTIKLIRFVLTVDTVRDHRLQHTKQINAYLRRWQSEFFTGKGCTLRPLLVHRAVIVHHTRVSSQTFSWKHTEEAKALIADLHKLTISDFTKLSSAALNTLVSSLQRSPFEITPAIYAMLDVIKSPKSTDEQLTGAIQFLSDKSVNGWICKKWNRLSAWMCTLAIQAQQHKDDKVQLKIHALFQSIFSLLHALPLHVSNVSSSLTSWPVYCPSANADIFVSSTSTSSSSSSSSASSVKLSSLSSEKVQERNKSLHFFNAKTQGIYRDLCTTLLKRGNERGIHWRYLMMSSAFLFSLLRSDTHTHVESKSEQDLVNQDLVMFFAQGLISDLLPLRKISIQAMSKILMGHAAVTRASVSMFSSLSAAASAAASPSSSNKPPPDFSQAIQTEKEWLQSEFSDYTFTGWLPETRSITCTYSKRAGPVSSSAMHKVDFDYFPYALSYTNLGAFDTPQITDTQMGSLLNESTHGTLGVWLSANFARVVDSLVADHPTLAPGTNNEKSSDPNMRNGRGAGDEIAGLVGRSAPGMGYQWPYSRLARCTDAFDKDHTYLIRGLVEAFPAVLLANTTENKESKEVLDLLKKFGTTKLSNTVFARQLMRLAISEAEQDQQVTATEMMAGLLRGSRNWAFDKQKLVHELILAVFIPMMDNAQPLCVTHFQDALRFMYTNSDPRRLLFLSHALFTNALGASPISNISDSNSNVKPTNSSNAMDLEDILDSTLLLLDSPSLQYKRLSYLNPVLIEQAWMSTKIGDWLLTRLMNSNSSYLDHTYQQVREAISLLLFFIGRNAFQARGNVQGVAASFYDYVSQRLASSANSNRAEEKERKDGGGEAPDKKAQFFLETMMYWLVKCHTIGDAVNFMDVMLRVLPSVLISQKHPDIQCAAVAKYSATLSAWVSSPASYFNGVLQCANEVSSSKSWSSRFAVLAFLQVFIPRHGLVLTSNQVQTALTLSCGLLTDTQVEVRTQASATLTSILMSTSISDATADKLRKQFVALAKTKLPPKTQKVADGNDAVVKRHGGVLGLSAMVTSNPYTVPDYLGSVLTLLADYTDDPLPISQGLVKLFAEFKRTHKDNWHEVQEKISEEDLDKITSVVFTPSYIV